MSISLCVVCKEHSNSAPFIYLFDIFNFMIRSFDGTMQSLGSLNYQTKLSSAGLVYLHYGRRVINEIIGKKLESSLLDIIYDKVYENFIEEIDAIDNGISQTEETGRYNIYQTLT